MLVKLEVVKVEWDGYEPDALLVLKPPKVERQHVGFLIRPYWAELIERTLKDPYSSGGVPDDISIIMQIIQLLSGDLVRVELWDDLRGDIWSDIVLRDYSGREFKLKSSTSLAVLLALRTGRPIFMRAELFDALVEEGLPRPEPSSNSDNDQEFDPRDWDELFRSLTSELGLDQESEDDEDDDGPKYKM